MLRRHDHASHNRVQGITGRRFGFFDIVAPDRHLDRIAGSVCRCRQCPDRSGAGRVCIYAVNSPGKRCRAPARDLLQIQIRLRDLRDRYCRRVVMGIGSSHFHGVNRRIKQESRGSGFFLHVVSAGRIDLHGLALTTGFCCQCCHLLRTGTVRIDSVYRALKGIVAVVIGSCRARCLLQVHIDLRYHRKRRQRLVPRSPLCLIKCRRIVIVILIAGIPGIKGIYDAVVGLLRRICRVDIFAQLAALQVPKQGLEDLLLLQFGDVCSGNLQDIVPGKGRFFCPRFRPAGSAHSRLFRRAFLEMKPSVHAVNPGGAHLVKVFGTLPGPFRILREIRCPSGIAADTELSRCGEFAVFLILYLARRPGEFIPFVLIPEDCAVGITRAFQDLRISFDRNRISGCRITLCGSAFCWICPFRFTGWVWIFRFTLLRFRFIRRLFIIRRKDQPVMIRIHQHRPVIPQMGCEISGHDCRCFRGGGRTDIVINSIAVVGTVEPLPVCIAGTDNNRLPDITRCIVPDIAALIARSTDHKNAGCICLLHGLHQGGILIRAVGAKGKVDDAHATLDRVLDTGIDRTRAAFAPGIQSFDTDHLRIRKLVCDHRKHLTAVAVIITRIISDHRYPLDHMGVLRNTGVDQGDDMILPSHGIGPVFGELRQLGNGIVLDHPASVVTGILFCGS